MHKCSQILNRAYQCQERREFAEALGYYQQALEQSPRSPQIWFEMGSCFYSLKDYQRALECSLHATDLDSEMELSWFNAAISCIKIEREDEALIYLGKAVDIQPTYFSAYRCRAGILEKQGRYTEALADWNAATKCPTVSVKDLEECHYYKATLYSNLKATDFALEAFQQLFSLNPKHWKGRQQRGYLYYQQDLLEEALKDLNFCLEQKEDSYTRMLRGAVYLKMKKTHSACEDLLG